MNKIIRLTETDLHRMVEEALKEIKGFHGNNPKDWAKLGGERYTRALDADESGEYRRKNFLKGVKNMKNANKTFKQQKEQS